MAHTICMLNKQGYLHVRALSNTYCFSTARVLRASMLRYTCIAYLVFKQSTFVHTQPQHHSTRSKQWTSMWNVECL